MGCVANLAAIAKECAGGNSPGFSTSIYVAEKSDLTLIPAATGHEVSGDITFDVGKFFFEWAVSRGNQTLTTTPEGEDENISYLTNLSFFIPKTSAAKSNILNSVTGAEFVILVKDKLGKYRIIGDLDEGAIMQVTEQVTEQNGYLINASWRSNNLPYIYSGVITTS